MYNQYVAVTEHAELTLKRYKKLMIIDGTIKSLPEK
jgi:hypothetical protein